MSGIPAMVAAELWTGIKRNLRTRPHHAARLEAFPSLFRIAEFTLDDALHHADIRAVLEAVGKPIGRSICSSPTRPAAWEPPSPAVKMHACSLSHKILHKASEEQPARKCLSRHYNSEFQMADPPQKMPEQFPGRNTQDAHIHSKKNKTKPLYSHRAD